MRQALMTVTPLSKLLALILFIIFPFVGFYFGMQYGSSMNYKNTMPQEPVVKEVKVYPTETPESLIQRCGLIPSEVAFRQENSTRVTGPYWSPDCRYVAWGIWESGTSYLGEDYDSAVRTMSVRPLETEGLFLFNDKTKRTEKIYVPHGSELIEMKEWKDSKSMVFTKSDENSYLYNIDTKEISVIVPENMD